MSGGGWTFGYKHTYFLVLLWGYVIWTSFQFGNWDLGQWLGFRGLDLLPIRLEVVGHLGCGLGGGCGRGGSFPISGKGFLGRQHDFRRDLARLSSTTVADLASICGQRLNCHMFAGSQWFMV